MSEILRVEHLKKYFKTPAGMLHAVDDVSFQLKKEKPWESLASPAVENQP